MRNKKSKPDFTLLLSIIGFILFSTLIIFVVPEFVKQRLELSWGIINSSKDINVGQIGDVFGGTTAPFIGLLASGLTFLAFYIQYKANQDVKNQFKVQQFESQVYKLVDIYRDNVARWSKIDKKTGDTFNDRLVPVTVLETYDVFLIELKYFITKWQDENKKVFYNEDYKKELNNLHHSKGQLVDNDEQMIEWMKMELAYMVVFFGLEDKGRENIKLHIGNLYNKNFIECLVNFFSYKVTHYSSKKDNFSVRFNRKNKVATDVNFQEYSIKNCKEVLDILLKETENIKSPLEDNDFPYKYYNGTEVLFSHHYRHLNSSFKYINDFKDIKYSIRWKVYAKLIRTQMSNSEQVLFFLNSISLLGRDWELNHNIDRNDLGKHNLEINNRLITKYDIIKNIPKGDRKKYKIECFYPDVEWEDIPMNELNVKEGQRYNYRMILEDEYYS